MPTSSARFSRYKKIHPFKRFCGHAHRQAQRLLDPAQRRREAPRAELLHKVVPGARVAEHDERRAAVAERLCRRLGLLQEERNMT